MEIKPFQVVHYPLARDVLERVVCPPYDKFTDALLTEFREKDANNFSHAILGESLTDHHFYPNAASTLRGWVQEGVLHREETEKFMVYRQTYESPFSGETMTRTGFYALLALPERDQQEVLPHERTFEEHKADRLRLYREVRGNPEGIFVLFSDPEGTVGSELSGIPMKVTFTDYAGHTNQLGLIDSDDAIKKIRSVVESQKLLIADGHHRFETGQNFRDECRAANPDAIGPQPYDYILVYLAALEDPGLQILPTHRLVKDIQAPEQSDFLKRASDLFEIETIEGAVTPDAISKAALDLNNSESDRETLGFVTKNKLTLLCLRDTEKLRSLLPPEVDACLRDLPVVWLHRVMFDQFLKVREDQGAPDRIGFARTGQDVFDGLNNGYQAAFLLRGTRPGEVKRVAESGVRMPQKSTDFYPKILSGIAAYLYP